MGRGRETHDVELVEDDAAGARPDATSDATPDAAPSPAARRRARRRRWAAGTAAVLVAGGMLAAQRVVDDRERDRLDRVREVAGAVVPPPAELEVLWASPDVLPRTAGRHDPWTSAGLRPREDGATEVVAVDAATGADRWVLPLVPARDGQGVGLGNGCVAAGDDRIACLGSDVGLTPAPTTGRLTLDGGTTSRVVVVDVPTGEVAADLDGTSADGVLAHAFAVAGGRAVLVGADASGTPHVWALDLATGRQVWATTLPAPDEDVLTALVAVDVPYALADGTVAVVARDGSATVLDPADGTVLRGPVRGTAPVVAVERLDGRTDLAVPRGEDADVLRAAGEVRVPGRLLPVLVDDGSLPGVLLSTGAGRVHAVDDRTGDVRWTAEVTLADAAAVLDGRVHVTGPSELVTLDGGDGARLWERERGSRTWSPGVLTDGTLLYEPRTAEGTAGRPELVGLDPADGTEERVVALSADVTSVQPWAGRPVLLGVDGLRVLG